MKSRRPMADGRMAIRSNLEFSGQKEIRIGEIIFDWEEANGNYLGGSR